MANSATYSRSHDDLCGLRRRLRSGSGVIRGSVLLAAGIVFGLVFYVVNFHIFTQLEQFAAFRMMAGNWFEIAVHAIFGALLAGGYAWWRDRRSSDGA